MAHPSLGPLKFVRDMGTLSHRSLIMTPSQEANGYNLGKSFSILYNHSMFNVLIRITSVKQL